MLKESLNLSWATGCLCVRATVLGPSIWSQICVSVVMCGVDVGVWNCSGAIVYIVDMLRFRLSIFVIVCSLSESKNAQAGCLSLPFL
jgi:hypothetical protein